MAASAPEDSFLPSGAFQNGYVVNCAHSLRQKQGTEVGASWKGPGPLPGPGRLRAAWSSGAPAGAPDAGHRDEPAVCPESLCSGSKASGCSVWSGSPALTADPRPGGQGCSEWHACRLVPTGKREQAEWAERSCPVGPRVGTGHVHDEPDEPGNWYPQMPWDLSPGPGDADEGLRPCSLGAQDVPDAPLRTLRSASKQDMWERGVLTSFSAGAADTGATFCIKQEHG